jgi:hypothetical protein
MVLTANIIFLICLLASVTAYAQSNPQDLKRQACEGLFQIIVQCQMSADQTRDNCAEVAGIISSPQNKDAIAQRKPDGATDQLIEETLKMSADMCRSACSSARQGNIYKTSQDWIDAGGCTM